MRFLYLVILAALIAVPSDAMGRKSEAGDTLKVMSYNIRTGNAKDGTYSWQYRYPATAMMLEQEMPDIIGLQEALEYQSAFIASNFKDYEYFGAGRDSGKKKGEAAGIFFNRKVLKIGKKGIFWLSEKPDKPSKGWDAAYKRTATWGIFTHKDSKNRFIFVNTHLDHAGKTAREEGLKLILKRIEEINEDQLPVILTGDFNVSPGDKCLKVLEGKMESAREIAAKTDHHGTFNKWGRMHNCILDYIYISGFSKCTEFRTVTEKQLNWKYISDHYPITALLLFNE